MNTSDYESGPETFRAEGTSESGEDPFPFADILCEWKTHVATAPMTTPLSTGSNSTFGSNKHKRPFWPTPKRYPAMCEHNGHLYVHGGQGDEDDAEECEMYRNLDAFQCSTGTWQPLQPGMYERSSHTMNTMCFKDRTMLLVMGGFDPNGLKPELFDVMSKEWLFPMVFERRLVECEDRGGMGDPCSSTCTEMLGATQTNSIAAYSTESGSGSNCGKELQFQRYRYEDNRTRYLHSSVCVTKDNITTLYMFAGMDPQQEILSDVVAVELSDYKVCSVLEPVGSAVRYTSPLHVELYHPECTGEAPCGRYGHSAALLGDAMLIFGGLDNKDHEELYFLYMLNLNTFMWSVVDTQMTPPQRMMFSFVAHEPTTTIVIFGGRGAENADADAQDAFVGVLTDAAESTNTPKSPEEKYVKSILDASEPCVSWRRILSHQGQYPRSTFGAACCVAPPATGSNDLRCFIFGGESGSRSTSALVELTVASSGLVEETRIAYEIVDDEESDAVQDDGVECEGSASDEIHRDDEEDDHDLRSTPDDYEHISSDQPLSIGGTHSESDANSALARSNVTEISNDDDAAPQQRKQYIHQSSGDEADDDHPSTSKDINTSGGKPLRATENNLTYSAESQNSIALLQAVHSLQVTMNEHFTEIVQRLAETNNKIDAVTNRMDRMEQKVHKMSSLGTEVSPVQHAVNTSMMQSLITIQAQLAQQQRSAR